MARRHYGFSGGAHKNKWLSRLANVVGVFLASLFLYRVVLGSPYSRRHGGSRGILLRLRNTIDALSSADPNAIQQHGEIAYEGIDSEDGVVANDGATSIVSDAVAGHSEREVTSAGDSSEGSDGALTSPSSSHSPRPHPTWRSGSASLPTVPPNWRADPELVITPSAPRAYVTMASGNDAARMAVALMQSIVTSGTKTSETDLVVLLPTNGRKSPECYDPTWKQQMNRSHIKCDDGADELIPEEIISPIYVDAFKRMGAKFLIHRPIPLTKYTDCIPGGPQASE